MNAQASLQLVPESADVGTATADGYFVSNEQLKRLGNGDIKAGRRLLRMMMADERETAPHVGPTAKPDTVQIATPVDEPEVLALVIENLSRNGPRWAPIDPKRVLDCIQNGTQQKRGGIVGVIRTSGKIVATTVLGIGQPAHSQTYFINEIFNVVHHEHRRSRHAQDLVMFGCWCSDTWTREFGYPVHLVAGVNTANNVREKLRFFSRYMTQIGGTFIYPTVKR